jgi:uncharacterized protein
MKINDLNREEFLKVAGARMPFGKYAGRLLLKLPEDYIIWFRNKGFPPGELGRLLALVYEIKINGLEKLFEPYMEKDSGTQE